MMTPFKVFIRKAAKTNVLTAEIMASKL
jgi:hypothetical protein